MKPRFSFVIPDTSCLILLTKIGEIEILNRLFDNVIVSTHVNIEFGEMLPPWVSIKSPRNHHYQELLMLEIDKGEASAIALHFETDNSILVLDDLKARKLGDKLKIDFTGTFGIILRAKKVGIIKSVKPILDKIKNTNFRFSEKIFDIVLKQAGEENE